MLVRLRDVDLNLLSHLTLGDTKPGVVMGEKRTDVCDYHGYVFG